METCLISKISFILLLLCVSLPLVNCGQGKDSKDQSSSSSTGERKGVPDPKGIPGRSNGTWRHSDSQRKTVQKVLLENVPPQVDQRRSRSSRSDGPWRKTDSQLDADKRGILGSVPPGPFGGTTRNSRHSDRPRKNSSSRKKTDQKVQLENVPTVGSDPLTVKSEIGPKTDFSKAQMPESSYSKAQIGHSKPKTSYLEAAIGHPNHASGISDDKKSIGSESNAEEKRKKPSEIVHPQKDLNVPDDPENAKEDLVSKYLRNLTRGLVESVKNLPPSANNEKNLEKIEDNNEDQQNLERKDTLTFNSEELANNKEFWHNFKGKWEPDEKEREAQEEASVQKKLITDQVKKTRKPRKKPSKNAPNSPIVIHQQQQRVPTPIQTVPHNPHPQVVPQHYVPAIPIPIGMPIEPIAVQPVVQVIVHHPIPAIGWPVYYDPHSHWHFAEQQQQQQWIMPQSQVHGYGHDGFEPMPTGSEASSSSGLVHGPASSKASSIHISPRDSTGNTAENPPKFKFNTQAESFEFGKNKNVEKEKPLKEKIIPKMEKATGRAEAYTQAKSDNEEEIVFVGSHERAENSKEKMLAKEKSLVENVPAVNEVEEIVYTPKSSRENSLNEAI